MPVEESELEMAVLPTIKIISYLKMGKQRV